MLHFIKKCYWIVCLTSTLSVYAQSQVGSFNATVNIQGPVNQTATGNSVKQDLNVGSAQKSKANSFSSTVTTGSITQTGRNGAQQIINVGGMNNSQADKFDAKVSTGNIEQIANHGEKQELDIGSVSNSTVGTAITRVSVGAIKQTGEGEIALGALKNSNVQQFKSDLVIGGKLEGNNIRMGSVVNQEKYNNNGKYTGKEALGSTTQSPQIQMPNFEIASRKDQISPIAEQESIQSPKYNIIEEIQTNSKLLDNISPTYKPWNELRNSEKIAVNLLIEAKPYAELASASYDFNKKSVGDWDLIETEGDNLLSIVNGGLQFGVYKNKNSNETVIAFRGTELSSYFDIINDVHGPLYGLNTPQFEMAYQKVTNLISSGKLGPNIKLVGHSLGGGLAQAVGATFGIETYAFNSAKVPAGFFNTHPIKLSSNLLQKKIHVISDVKDIISNGNLSTSTNYAINGLTSSHVTTNIQFDFDKKNVSPIFGEKAQSTSFSHHGIDKLINNLSELQDKYSSK